VEIQHFINRCWVWSPIAEILHFKAYLSIASNSKTSGADKVSRDRKIYKNLFFKSKFYMVCAMSEVLIVLVRIELPTLKSCIRDRGSE